MEHIGSLDQYKGFQSHWAI